MQSLALYSSQLRRDSADAAPSPLFFRPSAPEVLHYPQSDSFFDLDRRSNTREEHAEFCEAVLRDPHRFPSVPRYSYVPDFPLEDIYPKVIGTTEGMFPFVLSFSRDCSCEQLTAELKAKFKAGRWYLKQNTSFTQLSNCNIERSTFQIVGRSDARRQNKISLYVSKLVGSNSEYILEFRRSGRDVKEIPSEFLMIKKRHPIPMGSLFKLPKLLILPAVREHQLRAAADAAARVNNQTLMSVIMSIGTALNSHTSASFVDVDAELDASAAATFRWVVDSVDEANSSEPSRKKTRVDDLVTEDTPKALWWDLRPIDPELTTSFEEMIETIIRESNLHTRTGTIQDSFDVACTALSKHSGPRVTLLVIENSHLISQDISVLGRWMTLQKCLNAKMSSCKVILLNSLGRLDNLWLDRSLCLKVAPQNFSPSFPNTHSEDSSPTEEVSSDLSSASAGDRATSPPLLPLDSSNYDMAWSEEITWDGFDAPGGIVDARCSAVIHPSLEEIYDNFVAFRKRKYDTYINQHQPPQMGSSGLDAQLCPAYQQIMHHIFTNTTTSE